MHKPIYYFGMMMGVIYLLAGIYFLVWGGSFTGSMPPWFHIAFGILLIVYGIFRLARPHMLRRQ